MVYPQESEMRYDEELEISKSYFLKNLKKQEVGGIEFFEATNESTISRAKRGVTEPKR